MKSKKIAYLSVIILSCMFLLSSVSTWAYGEERIYPTPVIDYDVEIIYNSSTSTSGILIKSYPNGIKTYKMKFTDIVNVISPVGRLTPLGQAPKSQKFIVVGLFESGLYNYDNSLAFINLQSAQKFLGLGNVCNGIEVNVKNVYEAPKIASTLRTVLGHGYFCRDWTQMNKNFFAALKLEKTVMFIILTLIILVASFNIISTLIMVVMEKTRDIAILKAMGATNRMIMKIFVLEGVIIGAIGTILGLVGGFTLCSLLKKYKFIQLPADVYTISTLPVKIESLDVILITIATMLISLLATLYPSWQASRLNPSEALRYG